MGFCSRILSYTNTVIFYPSLQLFSVFIWLFMRIHYPSPRLVYFSWNFRLISQNTIQQHPENSRDLFPFRCVFLCRRWENRNHSNNVTLSFCSWERVRVEPSDQNTTRRVAVMCSGLLKLRCLWTIGFSASVDFTQFDCRSSLHCEESIENLCSLALCERHYIAWTLS